MSNKTQLQTNNLNFANNLLSMIKELPDQIPAQEKTVTPSAEGMEVTPDDGYALSKVILEGDSDLIPENIKSGIDIFGILGTMSEGMDLLDMFGYTEMAIDTFTFASRTASYTTINHSLGKKPLFIMIVTDQTPIQSAYSSGGDIKMIIGNMMPTQTKNYYGTELRYENLSSSNEYNDYYRMYCQGCALTVTDSTISSNQGGMYMAGVEYMVITMA